MNVLMLSMTSTDRQTNTLIGSSETGFINIGLRPTKGAIGNSQNEQGTLRIKSMRGYTLTKSNGSC